MAAISGMNRFAQIQAQQQAEKEQEKANPKQEQPQQAQNNSAMDKFNRINQEVTEGKIYETNKSYKEAYTIAREGLQAQEEWMKANGIDTEGNDLSNYKFKGDYHKGFDKMQELYKAQSDIIQRQGKSAQSYNEIASSERGMAYLRLNKTVHPMNKARVEPLDRDMSKTRKQGIHQ